MKRMTRTAMAIKTTVPATPIAVAAETLSAEDLDDDADEGTIVRRQSYPIQHRVLLTWRSLRATATTVCCCD